MIRYCEIQNFSEWEKELREFIRLVPFGRFLSDKRIEFDNSVEFELINLKNYSQKGSIILAIGEERDIVGLIGFHFSKWDTEVFLSRMAFLQYFLVKEFDPIGEKEIANNLVLAFHTWVKKNKISVVITKLDTQYFTPIIVLQQHGYILYECVTFRSLDVTKKMRSSIDDLQYRFATGADRTTLKKISLKNSFEKSHFYLDKNFKIERVELMYSKWIENALNSKQKIVIVEENNQIAGAFIYDLVAYSSILNKRFGIWKSAFVDTSFRGKGIGSKLFESTLNSCINDGVDIIDSTLVEKNIISQNFHDKLGFRLVNTLYTLHKWFD